MAERIAQLAARRELAPAVLELDLELVTPPAIAFRTGQFVSIRLDEAGDARRSYSLASRATRAHGFSLLVKVVPGGLGSQRLASLAPGDRVAFTGPMGFFVLEPAHPGDVVLVATGVGIAPIAPMLEDLRERGEAGRVHLYWGLRHLEDRFWQDRLAAIAAGFGAFSSTLCLSQPPAGWTGGEVGRVTAPVLRDAPGLREPTFYLCGHQGMIDDLRAALTSRGVGRRRIRSETFWT
jgi:CDP-4-dehydro-6-deoxyglucose reductase